MMIVGVSRLHTLVLAPQDSEDDSISLPKSCSGEDSSSIASDLELPPSVDSDVDEEDQEDAQCKRHCKQHFLEGTPGGEGAYV